MKSRKRYQVVVYGSQGEQLLKALSGFPRQAATSTQFQYTDRSNDSDADFTVILPSEFKRSSQEKPSDAIHTVSLFCPSNSAELSKLLYTPSTSSLPNPILVTAPTCKDTQEIHKLVEIKHAFSSTLLTAEYEKYYQGHPRKTGIYIHNFYGQIHRYIHNYYLNKLRLHTFCHASLKASGDKHGGEIKQNIAFTHFFHHPLFDRSVINNIGKFLVEPVPEQKVVLPTSTVGRKA